MKIIIMLSLLISFASACAQANEWVLWSYISSKGSFAAPVAESEHKSLKECTTSLLSVANTAKSKLNANHPDQKHETDGLGLVITSEKQVYKYATEWRCFPYGFVPTAANFTKTTIQ